MYKTSTELELLQGYFTEFKGMLSDIAEDIDLSDLRNAEAFNRVLSGMRKLCAEYDRYAREEHSADYERQSVDYDPEDARVYVTPQGGEIEAYIDPETGRRVGIDARGREWLYTLEPTDIEEEERGGDYLDETPADETLFRLGTMFSGIGAIEQALEQLNLQHVIDFAADIDADVKTSYLANYAPRAWYDDVCDIDGTKYKGLDLLVGGSPCQSFSSANKTPQGFNDTRGTLFYEFVRVLKEAQPRYFIYENVANVLRHDDGKTWEVMQTSFTQVNYNFSYQVLNAKDYNCPQRRRRIFVVGIRKDLDQSFSFPAPVPLTAKVSDYLETTPPVDTLFYFKRDGMSLEYALHIEKYIDLGRRVFGSHTLDRELACCFIKKQYVSYCGNYRLDFTPATPGEAPGYRFDIAYLKGMGVTDFSFMQGHTSARLRSLSSRELLRIQGFSDSFKIVVDKSAVAMQVGNSISVQVLKALCNQLLPELGAIQAPAPMPTQLELLPTQAPAPMPTQLELPSTPAAEEEEEQETPASVPASSVVPSSIGGTMLDNYTWYKDEKINGDARDIFTWILKADPRTCSPEQFIEGLLYARLDKAGKAASLTQRELVDLVMLRSFPGYPSTIKGVTDKVRAISKQLKASKDFTKKGLEEMTKRGYPTASFYTQAHITALEAARAPCSLPGDDLDEICALAVTAAPQEEETPAEPPTVEEETPAVDVTDAVSRARALLGL